MIRLAILLLVIVAGSAVWATVATRIGRRLVADDFLDWIDVEIERARRYGHEVALLRMSAPLAPATAAEALDLDGCLRALDRWHLDDGELLVLAPETPREGAERLAARLAARLEVGTGAARVATFPHDALTRRALMEHVVGSRVLLRRAS